MFCHPSKGEGQLGNSLSLLLQICSFSCETISDCNTRLKTTKIRNIVQLLSMAGDLTVKRVKQRISEEKKIRISRYLSIFKKTLQKKSSEILPKDKKVLVKGTDYIITNI